MHLMTPTMLTLDNVNLTPQLREHVVSALISNTHAPCTHATPDTHTHAHTYCARLPVQAKTRTEADLDKLIKATSEQYSSMISAEDERKRSNLRALKEKEEGVEEAFSQYRRMIEQELEEAIGFVEVGPR